MSAGQGNNHVTVMIVPTWPHDNRTLDTCLYCEPNFIINTVVIIKFIVEQSKPKIISNNCKNECPHRAYSYCIKHIFFN